MLLVNSVYVCFFRYFNVLFFYSTCFLQCCYNAKVSADLKIKKTACLVFVEFVT